MKRFRMLVFPLFLSVAIMLAFIVYYENHTKELAKARINEYAKLFAPALWEMNKEACVHYARIILNNPLTLSLEIVDEKNDPFIKITESKTINSFDTFLRKVNLFEA